MADTDGRRQSSLAQSDWRESALRPSPQLVPRALPSPTQQNRPQLQSQISYGAQSPTGSVNEFPPNATRASSLRSPPAAKPGNAGLRNSSSTTASKGGSAVLQSPSSSKYAPSRYQQSLSSPPASGAPAVARSHLVRHSTATSISTLSGGVPYSQSPSFTNYADSVTSHRRNLGPLLPQSEITLNAEQMSGTAALPTVRPTVDTHDAIWSDLDIMDDIEDVAGQVGREGNFFGREHLEALDELQRTQIELAITMEKGEDVIDLVADQGKLWEVNDNDISFAKSSKVFNESHFDHVQQVVDAVMDKLDKVVESMKILENQSRDLWNEKPDQV